MPFGPQLHGKPVHEAESQCGSPVVCRRRALMAKAAGALTLTIYF